MQDNKPTNFQMVAQWHLLAGVLPSEVPSLGDALSPKLIKEEAFEYLEALASGDLPHTVKELGDLLYVTYRALYSMGVDADVVFNEITRSNFSKFCKDENIAQDSVNYLNLKMDDINYSDYREERGLYIVYRKEDGKLLKGIGYSEADFSSLVEAKSEVGK